MPFNRLFTCSAILPAVLALGACGKPATAPGPNPVSATAPAPVVGRTESAWAAAEVLRQTSQARDAVAAKLQAAALDHVDQALLATAKLAGQASAPIYTELDQISLLGPIAAAAQGKATSAAPKDDLPEVKAAAAGRTATMPAQKAATVAVEGAGRSDEAARAIKAVSSDYTRVSLYVNLARTHLSAARAALVQNDFNQASADLAAVDRAVLVEAVTANRPLLRAREDLGLAREAIVQGRPGDATAALRSAASGLRNYARSASVRHSAEAISLAGDIDAYHPKSGEDASRATAKINAWWDSVALWLDEKA